MSEVLLTAREVTKTAQDGEHRLVLLNKVSLELRQGERVALLGPSGSGKSSLLHILGALDPEFQGSVELRGVTLSGLDDHRLAAVRNQHIGFVFQAYNLLAHLSALENVLLPARFGPGRPDESRAREVLRRVGLADKTHRLPATLSGGERQRVAIARALYCRPQLVLCDEPTGNLDRDTGREVLSLFDELTREGVALLIATHDEAIAHEAHRTLRLVNGELQ